jgi:hypothetical protein
LTGEGANDETTPFSPSFPKTFGNGIISAPVTGCDGALLLWRCGRRLAVAMLLLIEARWISLALFHAIEKKG